ncbi:SGNH/GDSL hydrolase family protein [Tsukamurella sp. 8F]|uniref:diglucosylglycerate octanoyltransferase n=1 Tax=unclassified Tsukamurella TaxID=2633480 RepID=UPI0023B8DFE1|nr:MULTISPECIES: diglucosylglycerate octanoyltransferase [unclassified Tsukamurella]MDF0532243.1 SGNH/GDSL hydrolase family protein [Tsukamurella sp. 8J]MDF0588055.1 SGNH/GDSL hydrolase family protein [Tsukamurella sp. 8F]
MTALLVLSDSLGYYGPEGALPADDPRIWPNLAASELGMDPELIGRVGWTTRDGWWAVSQDPRVWAAVPRVDAVVLALGGMDSLPSPLPTAMREQIRYIRPASLRALARDGYGRMQRVLAPVGWPMALPPKVTVEYLERTRAALAALRPSAPIVTLGPATQRAYAYGYAHPGWAATDRAMREWADRSDVGYVPVRDLCDWSFDLGGNNIDGIHWAFDMHAAVAERVAAALRANGSQANGSQANGGGTR